MVGDLLALVAGPNLSGAVCTDPAVRQLFDDPASVREAKWACHRCPVESACREWVLSLPPADRPRGVVGGVHVMGGGAVDAQI